MIVYDGLKTDFLSSCERDSIAIEIEENEIIKNTYRTLLTRGMKGCYIYCTDPGMTAYLKKRLERVKHEAGNN